MTSFFGKAAYAAQMVIEGLPNTDAGDGSGLFGDILNVAYFAAGIVGVIVIILAGFMYVTSAGDPGKAKTAKNAILYTVVGLIFVIMAASITAFIRARMS